KNLAGYLHQQPCDDCVGDRNLIDVASFQLSEEVLRVHESSRRTFLWRQRGDNFLEARIAAQGIQGRKQFQLAVAKRRARKPGCNRQLLASEVFLTDPGSDDSEELNHMSAVDGIFCHRQKLNRPATLAQRILFLSKSSVDQAKHAKSGAVIGLCLHNLLLSSTGLCKSGVRRRGVTFHASKQAFKVGSAKYNRSEERRVGKECRTRWLR